MLDNYKAARAAGLFRAFGDADRVRIVSAILEQEMNTSMLAEMMGTTESSVSHHLHVLRQMRLVKARRERREVYYRIDDPHIIAMFEQGIRYVEGVLIFYWPDVTTIVLLYFIAVRAVTTGFFETLAAIEFRQVFPEEWRMSIGGMLSTLLGTLLFVFPAEGTMSLVWLIGIYVIIAGLIQLIFAFRLQCLLREPETAIVSGA